VKTSFSVVILILPGLRLFFARPQEKALKSRGRGVAGAFASTFFLMPANPMPILIFTATFNKHYRVDEV